MLFLIEYDRSAGQVVTFRSFQDSQRDFAESARLDLEVGLNRIGVDHEVVLLQAASEAALRVTHRRYFEDLPSLATLSDKLGGSASSG